MAKKTKVIKLCSHCMIVITESNEIFMQDEKEVCKKCWKELNEYWTKRLKEIGIDAYMIERYGE